MLISLHGGYVMVPLHNYVHTRTGEEKSCTGATTLANMPHSDLTVVIINNGAQVGFVRSLVARPEINYNELILKLKAEKFSQ
jgi:hypothetical protein